MLYNLLFKNLFSFKGRSSREEYTCRMFLMATLMIVWSYTIDIYGNTDSISSFLYVLILGGSGILMFFQYFPLAIRRLHDLNASGWYVLLTFVPFGQFLILWLMFKEGTQGSNKYGEEPKYRETIQL